MNPMNDEVWLHELRNAVNSALVSTSVVKSLLEDGDAAGAMSFVVDAQEACERCRLLVLETPADGSVETNSLLQG